MGQPLGQLEADESAADSTDDEGHRHPPIDQARKGIAGGGGGAEGGHRNQRGTDRIQ